MSKFNILISSAVLFWQTVQSQILPKPEFEAASIRQMPAPRPGTRITGSQRGGPGTSDPGLFECGNCSLATLVMRAFDVRSFQFEAPQWLWTQQFRLTAKVPPGTTKEQFQAMFQRLIEERFKLTYHRHKKNVDGYLLVVARNGTKLKEHTAVTPPDPIRSLSEARIGKDGFPDQVGLYNTPSGNKLRYTNQSMAQLAMNLTPAAGLPVVDGTGLGGTYDITLVWSSSVSAVPPESELGDNEREPGVGLLGALQSQLGLRLEARKLSVDVLVVDQIEKTPVEN